MLQTTISAKDAALLRQGDVPENEDILHAISIGHQKLLDFLSRQYLESYIPEGGSKIKMITGRPGAGKTHFSRLILQEASSRHYLTVRFSAESIWLHDFREIYLEVLRQCGLEQILEGCARQMILEMGYDPEQISDGKTFMDYLSEKGEGDVIIRGEIRRLLRKYFTRNPVLDNSFAACCSLLTGNILGHPTLESSQRDLLTAYMYGDKTVKLSQLRALGLSPSRITKYNARYLLRSLAETAHLGGFPGILIVIDDMEILQKKTSASPIHYAKIRREDTYESIRQLIDDIDNMRHLMFLLCFDRILMDNEDYGMKSYQALWMRVQNEVVSSRFNAFADIIDLDRYADQFYTPAVLCEMAQKLYDLLFPGKKKAAALDEEMAENLIQQSQYGGLGLPYLVNRRIIEDEPQSGSDEIISRTEGGEPNV